MARIPASCRSSLNVPRIQGNDGWQYAVFPPRRSGLAPFAPRHRKTYQIPAFAASGFRSGVTRQSKRRFVRVNASGGVYSDKRVYLAGSFGGRRCVNWHEKPCWRASAAPGSAFKEQGAARGGRFAEAVCQSKRLPLLGPGFTTCRMLSRWDREPPFGDATRTPGP